MLRSLATLHWEPYVGRDLKNYGFTSEIVTEAFRRVGYEVTVTFMPWARVIQEVKRKKYDAAYPAYYSDERARVFALSRPFAQGPLVFYKRKAAKISFKTLQDLKPYRIGVVRGYVNSPAFDAADYLKKEFTNSDESNLRKLLKGRIDLVVIDKYTAEHLIKRAIPEGLNQLESLEPYLQVKQLYLAVSRRVSGYQQMLEAFNYGLRQITEDGSIKKIMKKHGFH